MNERDRIIAGMSPIELAAYAEIGGRVGPVKLAEARQAVVAREAELWQRRAIRRAVMVALQVWWHRPGVLDHLWAEALDEDATKVCPRCHRSKGPREFYVDRLRPDGRPSLCKACQRGISAAARRRHKRVAA
jgi:hypothetical protein